jgi:hypothetical protein
MKLFVFLLLSITALHIVRTPADAQPLPGSPHPTTADYAALLAGPHTEDAIEKFLALLPSTEAAGGAKLYILEGDIAVDHEVAVAEIHQWISNSSSHSSAHDIVGPELNILQASNHDVFWPRNSRNFTYYIDPVSFAGRSIDLVRHNLAHAASDWEDTCHKCGISFTETLNAPASPPNTFFTVIFIPSATSYFALSFFPNSSLADHILRISPLYFATTYSQVGLLRHELGHILGYRHEAINSLAGCAIEDNGDWRTITVPDAKSVMHYTCGLADSAGPAERELQLTPTDISSHSKIYGP